MLRVIARFVGLMLLAAGFSAAVVDGARSIASNTLVLTSFAETIAQLSPARLALIQAGLEKRLGHWAWDPAATTLMALPTWLVVGGLGGLIFLATRRRRQGAGALRR